MKYKIISQEDIEYNEKDHDRLLSQKFILENRIKELEKILYPYHPDNEPRILNIHNTCRQLAIDFRIGEYSHPDGNHVIVRDYQENKKLEFSYYADDFHMSKYLKIQMIERFLTELLETK